MRYLIAVILSLVCYTANAQIATKASDLIGTKIDGKTVTSVQLQSDTEINDDVAKLEQDIPDRTSFCQTQYAQCQAQIEGMQKKLDTIKPYKTVVEVKPIEEPIAEGEVK